ncbi:polysaccharide deacetylase family protein [Methylocella silvestris]|uniref:Chitooligosaccharide deacetylase n=1 Tax=Methylocella silvestris TaxID=199596 RepID=A0A2J7TBS6_METSI|nr:polysaccharide deacetylase family protein [Methylocella silvestris]PNG24221.1 polysaccharide deacetylase [Methylocella silvestris]
MSRRLLPRATMLAAAALFALRAPAGAATAPKACSPDALGVSRTIAFSAKGGLAIGFKSYPKTLDLADHEVVLTFDDGPAAGTTAKILDALAAECVKATFFLIGRNARGLPALARREASEGHTVAHHSFSHPDMRRLSEAAAKKNIDEGFAADDTAAYGAAASEPRTPFFRYPGFSDTPTLNGWLASRNIAVFGADLWASDWNKMTPQEELDLVMSRLEAANGGILLLHDIKVETAAMLPQLLREMKRRGFRIVHIRPGDDPPPLRDAPAGWSSETEKIAAGFYARMPAPRAAKRP